MRKNVDPNACPITCSAMHSVVRLLVGHACSCCDEWFCSCTRVTMPGEVQERLDRIDNERTSGIFGGNTAHVPPGQAACSELLHDCYRLVDVAQRCTACAPALSPDPYKNYMAVSECMAAHEE